MPTGTNKDTFADMLDQLRTNINWKITVRDDDRTIYRQVNRRYFEKISRTLCRMEIRSFFPDQTSALISGLTDAILEDKNRIFDDAIFLKSRERIIGFSNAVFDLKIGKVRPYQPSDYVLDPIPYDIPDQIDPGVSAWIENIFCEWVGREVGGWFMDILAYFLFIYPNNQNLWLNLFGAGCNGKSSCLHLIEEIVGETKVNGCDLRNIGRFSGDAFKSKWLIVGRDSGNVVSEQATSFIKAYTGEKKLHIEKKGGAEYDDANPGKLIVSTNYLIQSKDRSYGWYRRLVPIPFMNRFAINPKFEDSLLRKTPDISRILLHRAYLITHNETLLMKSAPLAVRELRNETRMLNDRIAAFWTLFFHKPIEHTSTNNGFDYVETSYELDPSSLLFIDGKTMSEVYDVYRGWHEDEFGETDVEPSLKTFGGAYGAFLQSEAGEYFEWRRQNSGRKVFLRPEYKQQFGSHVTEEEEQVF